MNKAKISIYAAVLSSLVMFPAVSMAKSGYFVSGQVGGALPMDKLTHDAPTASHKKKPKAAVVFDIGAGKEVYKDTFVELEGAYASHKFGNSFKDLTVPGNIKTKVQSLSGFANLSYRFNAIKMPIVPYFTAGIGVASNQVKNITLVDSNGSYRAKGKTKTDLAWQVGAGVLMPVTNDIDVNLSYKYRDLGKVKAPAFTTVPASSDPALKGKLRTSNILLGINFNF